MRKKRSECRFLVGIGFSAGWVYWVGQEDGVDRVYWSLGPDGDTYARVDTYGGTMHWCTAERWAEGK